MIAQRPSFTNTLIALRANAVTPAEHDLLATVEYITGSHMSAAETPDMAGVWGVCLECAEPWPCPGWEATESACVEWLVQRSSLTVRAVREHLDRKGAA